MNCLSKFLNRISGADKEISELEKYNLESAEKIKSLLQENWDYYDKLKVTREIPIHSKWHAIDQKTVSGFLKSEQGIKFVEACRHKIYSDHINACQKTGSAEQDNAAIRGANNIVFFMLSLAHEDSISGSSPVNEQMPDSDHAQSEVLNTGR